MKRKLVVLLLSAVCVCSLVACKGKDAKAETKDTVVETVDVSTEETSKTETEEELEETGTEEGTDAEETEVTDGTDVEEETEEENELETDATDVEMLEETALPEGDAVENATVEKAE